eukprot:3204828-Pyramimonas_sp.AAC.1
MRPLARYRNYAVSVNGFRCCAKAREKTHDRLKTITSFQDRSADGHKRIWTSIGPRPTPHGTNTAPGQETRANAEDKGGEDREEEEGEEKRRGRRKKRKEEREKKEEEDEEHKWRR